MLAVVATSLVEGEPVVVATLVVVTILEVADELTLMGEAVVAVVVVVVPLSLGTRSMVSAVAFHSASGMMTRGSVLAFLMERSRWR